MDGSREYNQRQERTQFPTRGAASLDQRYRDPHDPRGYSASHQGWKRLTLEEHCNQNDSTDYTKYLEPGYFSNEGTAFPQDYSQPQYQGQGQDYYIGEHTCNQAYNAYNDIPQFGQTSSEHQSWSGYDYGRISSQREQEHSQPQDLGYYDVAQGQDYHDAGTSEKREVAELTDQEKHNVLMNLKSIADNVNSAKKFQSKNLRKDGHFMINYKKVAKYKSSQNGLIYILESYTRREEAYASYQEMIRAYKDNKYNSLERGWLEKMGIPKEE